MSPVKPITPKAQFPQEQPAGEIVFRE